jgi:hypothetical protein
MTVAPVCIDYVYLSVPYLRSCKILKPNFYVPNNSYFSKPTITNSVSRHILSNVFDQSFDIAVVFQNQPFHLFCLPCHVLIIYTCTESQFLTLS